MTTVQTSSQQTYKDLAKLSFGGNFLGGLITFLYLAIIDPLPVGEASVRSLEPVNFIPFVIAVAVIFAGAIVLNRRLFSPIQKWQQRIESGAPASDLPLRIARRILSWPLIGAAFIAGTWMFMATFFAIFYGNPSNFVGIAIGGVVTTAVVFSGSDLLWRRIIPLFFPEGNLSNVPAFHLWVQRRLLLAFILIGTITPTLLVILTQ